MNRHAILPLVVLLLLIPVRGTTQIQKARDLVKREKIINQIPLNDQIERAYQHRQTLNTADHGETTQVMREWTTKQTLLDHEARDGHYVFVTSVSVSNVQIDTNVKKSMVADTVSWLFNEPTDHLVVYTSVKNRIYRNEVRGLEWPVNKERILSKYSDASQLKARPPWFILPPYSGQCLNSEGITADRCNLGLGPRRGAKRSWKLFLTNESTRETEEGKVDQRTFLVTFPGGQVIKRRFVEGEGLVTEQTNAGWTGVTKLTGLEPVNKETGGDTVNDESRAEPNTPPDQPDVPTPNVPNSPNRGPEDREPPTPNEPNEPTNSDF